MAAKRARQLQNGQRSVLPASNKKPTVLAMEEVRRGLVPYEDLNQIEAHQLEVNQIDPSQGEPDFTAAK